MNQTEYCYQPLSPGEDMIRLLRLLSHESRDAPIKCQLFNYTLQDSGRRTHPYEALSYVWGDPVNPGSISIDKCKLPVTQNLYRALSHLRHRSIDRILWVDAVCINQGDTAEKEQQIQFMAKIYAQASCVLVWLGECADNSDQALEEIRVAASGKKSSSPSNLGMIHKAISSLLQRPWFRRIWVLQEVAAARHVLITCGSAEIDGYAFCLGVSSLDFYDNDLELQSLVRSVTYLIREAIFRPGYAMSKSGRFSLDICPLAELVDMYHTREATKVHDKVFALLGMSSDDLSEANLSYRYEDPWEKLFQNLTKFLLCDKISTETFDNKQITLIKSKGCILGRVSDSQSDLAQGGSQRVEIIFNSISRQLGYKDKSSAHWILHSSANSVRKGDFVCLLQGTSKPTIIRLHDDHFDIIMIVATPPEGMLKLSRSMKTLSRDFLLIWDWEKAPREVQGPEQHETSLQTNHMASEHSKIGSEDLLGKATRTWKVAIILEVSAEHVSAQEKIQEAINGYETAAKSGHRDMVKHLLEMGEVEVDFKHKDGATPLWWAAKGGHEIMVNLLLDTGEANIDSKHEDGTTPLWWAAKRGHLAIVKRLLQENAEVNIVGGDGGMTAMEAAAGGGHLDVVERLLQEKAEVNTTALQAAAGGGHLTVVERLLQEKVETNAKARYNRRIALQAAAKEGHLPVVERLLKEKAEVNTQVGNSGMTALQMAAGGGHLAVVDRLLREKAEINAVAAKYGGRTALQAAAGGGHLAVVERLLQEKAEVNAAAAESGGRTALQAAAGGGHLAVVERLLQEKAEVDAAAAEFSGRTALQAAAEGGHFTVVERLLQEKAEVDTAAAKYIMTTASQQNHKVVAELLLKYKSNAAIGDKDGYTCLHFAVFAENEAMVLEFLDPESVNERDHYGATPLHYASKQGHEKIVELLLKGGADVDAVCNNIDTAIILASWRNHKPVVDLLLEYGADATIPNKEGYTCLHFAVEARNKAMVLALLDSGAPIEKSGGGETPLASSIRRGYDEITRLLEERSENVQRDRGGQTSNGDSSEGCLVM